jgi:hypothetical protein
MEKIRLKLFQKKKMDKTGIFSLNYLQLFRYVAKNIIFIWILVKVAGNSDITLTPWFRRCHKYAFWKIRRRRISVELAFENKTSLCHSQLTIGRSCIGHEMFLIFFFKSSSLLPFPSKYLRCVNGEKRCKIRLHFYGTLKHFKCKYFDKFVLKIWFCQEPMRVYKYVGTYV